MRRCCSNRNDNPHVSIRVVTAEKFTSYQHFIVLSLPLLTTIICLLLLLELAITHSHLIPKLSVFLTCSLTWFSEILINAGLKMSKSLPHTQPHWFPLITPCNLCMRYSCLWFYRFNWNILFVCITMSLWWIRHRTITYGMNRASKYTFTVMPDDLPADSPGNLKHQ